MSKEGSSNKVMITVAVLTSITSICIAVITGVFGLQAVQMQQKAESTSAAVQIIATQGGATQVSLEGTVNAPTSTFYPTFTPLSTYTPYPSLTPFPTLAYTATPSVVVNLPFRDDFSDGLASEWTVTGKQAVVNGFIRNVEPDKKLLLDLNSNFLPNYTISFDFDGMTYLIGDRNVVIYITVNNKFRCAIRNYISKWQSFENNQWIDIPGGNMRTEFYVGNVKINIFNNTYQLFINGELRSVVTYGDPLPGPVSISLGESAAIKNFEMTSP